jgi:hypothetical protein
MNNFEKLTQQKTPDLQEKIKEEAIKAAELSVLRTNPKGKYEQGSLSEEDFDYIEKVEKLADERLQDPEYLERLSREILKQQTPSTITTDDELYSNDLLNQYNHQKYGKDNKAA